MPETPQTDETTQDRQAVHWPQVATLYVPDHAVFVPGCTCGWQGADTDGIVAAARSAHDHARMAREQVRATGAAAQPEDHGGTDRGEADHG